MEKTKAIGPYSRPTTLRKLDQRTREAKHMQAVRRELTAHVGGAPSATQRALIDRFAWLSLHVAMLDAKTAERGEMTEHDSRTYLAWSNSLSRSLRALGIKAAAEKPPTLAQHLAQRVAS
jgi:hypothetical protein